LPPGGQLLSLAAYLDFPIQQDEELLTQRALADQHLPLSHFELVRDRGKPGQLALREAREQRDRREQLDLRILA
jgi:hypothetical protein